MRSEQEMMDLLLGIAKKDERIRAVYMNGSRTNPYVSKDQFQDYDIVYAVTETASFLQDAAWIHQFGELLMVQEPDKLDQGIGREVDFTRSYTYLMLFQDGNRIDLQIETKESMLSGYVRDKLTIPLLDKDGWLPPIPPPTDVDYHVKKPSVCKLHKQFLVVPAKRCKRHTERRAALRQANVRKDFRSFVRSAG